MREHPNAQLDERQRRSLMAIAYKCTRNFTRRKVRLVDSQNGQHACRSSTPASTTDGDETGRRRRSGSLTDLISLRIHSVDDPCKTAMCLVNDITSPSPDSHQINWMPDAKCFEFFKHKMESKLGYDPSTHVIVYTDDSNIRMEIRDEEDFMTAVKNDVAMRNYRIHFGLEKRRMTPITRRKRSPPKA